MWGSMGAMALIYVAAGGAFGSLLRYVTGDMVARYNTTEFPFGTFGVNIAGSLLMGVWIALAAMLLPAKAKDLHLLIAVGALGGFTTFSTFSLDIFQLAVRGAYGQAGLYMLGSVVLSLAALIGGMWAVKLAFG